MYGTANPWLEARGAHIRVYLFVPTPVGIALSWRPSLDKTVFRFPVFMVVAVVSIGVSTKLLLALVVTDRSVRPTSLAAVLRDRVPRAELLGNAMDEGTEYSRVPSVSVSTPNVAVFPVYVLYTSHCIGACKGMGAPTPVASVLTLGRGPATGLNIVCWVSSRVTVTGFPAAMFVMSSHADWGTFAAGKGSHRDGTL